MRATILAPLLAVVGLATAAAQPPASPLDPGLLAPGALQLQLNLLQAQQQMAQRQALATEAQAAALAAQLRTERNLADIRAQSVAPAIPPRPAGAPPADMDVSALASIPDAALADSDAKVRAAANNHH